MFSSTGFPKDHLYYFSPSLMVKIIYKKYHHHFIKHLKDYLYILSFALRMWAKQFIEVVLCLEAYTKWRMIETLGTEEILKEQTYLCSPIKGWTQKNEKSVQRLMFLGQPQITNTITNERKRYWNRNRAIIYSI